MLERGGQPVALRLAGAFFLQPAWEQATRVRPSGQSRLSWSTTASRVAVLQYSRNPIRAIIVLRKYDLRAAA